MGSKAPQLPPNERPGRVPPPPPPLKQSRPNLDMPPVVICESAHSEEVEPRWFDKISRRRGWVPLDAGDKMTVTVDGEMFVVHRIK